MILCVENMHILAYIGPPAFHIKVGFFYTSEFSVIMSMTRGTGLETKYTKCDMRSQKSRFFSGIPIQW